MNFKIIDLSTVTSDELIQAITSNIQTARLMSSEIEKLKASAHVRKVSYDEVLEIDTSEDESSLPIDSDFEDEVDYYYHLLRSYTEHGVGDDISSVLPSRNNYNYRRILIRLKAEIIKKIKEIKDFIGDEHLSLEDIAVFKDDLDYERKCMELIDSQLHEENEDCVEVTDNKLIFFPSPSGNIHVLDYLEGIDSDFYSRFNELFLSIKNGTFKGAKRFNNNDALNGFCEVKGTSVRVMYSRLSSDCYAIITAFVKKTDKDQAYTNFIVKHCRDFKNIEDVLKSKLDDPEFMELNKQYEDELFRILADGEKKKPLVKNRGDIDE